MSGAARLLVGGSPVSPVVVLPPRTPESPVWEGCLTSRWGLGRRPQCAGGKTLKTNMAPGGARPIFKVCHVSFGGRGGGDPAPVAKAVAYEMPCRRSPLPGADAEFNN